MIAVNAGRRPKTPGLPPELVGSVPREVRLTSGGIAVAVTATVWGVGALVAAIVMMLAYIQSAAEAERREREAMAVSADIIRVEVSRGEHPRPTVTYRYTVDDHTYTRRTRLRERDNRRVTNGGVIAVAYLRSEPATSWVAGYGESTRFPLAVIPLVVGSLLVVAAVLVFSLRRQWMLLSEGRVAEARVTGVKKVKTDKGTTTYSLSYEFQTISGALLTSRCRIGSTPPPIGATIPVVYHRERPEWSVMYPLQFVKPGRLVQ